jgi:predicted acylesterase/phospholipase RssA
MECAPQDRLFEEFDRLAVVTIQGGGVFGLSLLGQLSTLVYQLKIVPLALAGSSAGAIVAALYWAGYTPKGIRDLFVKLAQAGKLPHILGPFEPSTRPFTFESLRDRRQRFAGYGAWALRQFQPRKELFLIRWGMMVPRGVYTALKAGSIFKKVIADVSLHVANLGLFRGAELELLIEEWIRSSPRLAPYAKDLPQAEPLQFRQLQEVYEKRGGPYLPMLFLTATNVTTRQLQLISSIDPDCQNVPIARAVRASAGFPVILRPVPLPEAPEAGWYVDGGVVSNFPAWIFADATRQRLTESPVYAGLVSRPLVHLGLRLAVDPQEAADEQPTPLQFGWSLVQILTGHGRNQLEDMLASQVARSWYVRQPFRDTGGPPDMWQLEKIDAAKVQEMYEKGAEQASRELASVTFALPAASVVEELLRALIARVLGILGETDNRRLHLRSNIFLPQRDLLVLRYSVHMEGDPDEHLVLRAGTGLSGFCFTRRAPQICNLEQIRRLAEAGVLQPNQLFGMRPDEHLAVREDRTWLASVPIFDPLATYSRDLAARTSRWEPELEGRYYQQLHSPVDGAIFGVLNLDAALPYRAFGLAEEPERYGEDPRIQGIMDVMQMVSLRVGNVLAAHFAGRGASA